MTNSEGEKCGLCMLCSPVAHDVAMRVSAPRSNARCSWTERVDQNAGVHLGTAPKSSTAKSVPCLLRTEPRHIRHSAMQNSVVVFVATAGHCLAFLSLRAIGNLFVCSFWGVVLLVAPGPPRTADKPTHEKGDAPYDKHQRPLFPFHYPHMQGARTGVHTHTHKTRAQPPRHTQRQRRHNMCNAAPVANSPTPLFTCTRRHADTLDLALFVPLGRAVCRPARMPSTPPIRRIR